MRYAMKPTMSNQERHRLLAEKRLQTLIYWDGEKRKESKESIESIESEE